MLMLRLCYRILSYLLLPVICGWLYNPMRKRPAFGPRWVEHFGFGYAPLKQAPTLWLHAVSVGELMAARSLLLQLAQTYPSHLIVVTTTTSTSAQLLKNLNIPCVHYFAPLDYIFAIRRFLKHVQPQILLLLETEIWPNWLHSCEKLKIPVLCINARLSQRSFLRYAKFRRFFPHLTQSIRLFCCQSEQDARRFSKLGINQQRLVVTNSLKFEQALDPKRLHQGQRLRAQWHRPLVWIAGSTHAPEESWLLTIHEQLRETFPDLLLLLVPRHIERTEEIITICHQKKICVVRRSQGATPTANTAVYLCDTTGELNMLYAACDIAFVGGSLVVHGGHNPLEPASLGIPVLFGPHIFNFSKIYTQLKKEHAGVLCHDTQNLKNTLENLLNHTNKRLKMGAHAQQLIRKNQGALTKVMRCIGDYIPRAYPSVTASQSASVKAKIG